MSLFKPALALLLALLAPPALAETLPAEIAEQFASALSAGDAAAARRLLDPQVLVYETGGEEASRAAYAATHLGADIDFMSRVKRAVLSRREGRAGELAWVATRVRLTGIFKDKPVDLFSTESLVMKLGPEGWRIVHVHWSSVPAARAGG